MSKPKIVRYKSGARLVYERVRDCDYVMLRIEIEVGSAVEKPSEYGIAHFFEHMFFTSTEKLSKRERNEFLESKGAWYNAYTHRKHTCYLLQCLSENFNECLEVFCQGFNYLIFDQNDIENERKIILEERKGNFSNISKRANSLLSRNFYDCKKFSHDMIGTDETIKGINAAKLRAFMKNYTPEKFIISGCGGLPLKKFKSAIERCLGEILLRSSSENSQKIEPKLSLSQN